MRAVFLYILWPFGALILYKLVSSIYTRIRNAKTARQLGGKAPPTLPSPDPLGIINVSELIRANNAGVLTDYIKDRFEDVSVLEGRPVLTLQTHVFRSWLFVTCDPKNIQAILATQFKEFHLGPIRHGTFAPMLGNGIFSADGKRWEHSRALLRPQFIRDQVSDLDLEERHMQNMMKALPVNPDGSTNLVDLMPLFYRLTMDSATEFLFGESVNTQLAELPGYDDLANVQEHAEFVHAFENSQDIIARAFRLNDYFKLGLTKEYYEGCKVCHRYIDRFVQKALNLEKTGRSLAPGESAKYHFLEGLAGETRDPVEIRDQLLSILVAGRDTTASTLSWLWLMLSQHQEVFFKLRKAVLADFGPHSSTAKISFSSLKACSYLQWCLNETLRLFPAVPLNSRRSLVDTTLPRGGGPDGLSPIFVPKDTEVNYSVYAMMRNKTLWGPDAEEFIPERWDGRKVGFEYLPFNAGPRICLGQQFALTEAGYVTVRLLQRFDGLDGAEMAKLPFDREWYLTLTGRPKHGVKVRLHATKE